MGPAMGRRTPWPGIGLRRRSATGSHPGRSWETRGGGDSPPVARCGTTTQPPGRRGRQRPACLSASSRRPVTVIVFSGSGGLSSAVTGRGEKNMVASQPSRPSRRIVGYSGVACVMTPGFEWSVLIRLGSNDQCNKGRHLVVDMARLCADPAPRWATVPPTRSQLQSGRGRVGRPGPTAWRVIS